MSERYIVIESELDDIYIGAKDDYIVGLFIGKEEFLAWKKDRNVEKAVDDPLLQEAARQVKEYFRGERKEFQLPLHLNGTPFQKEVWKALLQIPYGETKSYKDIAETIGNPKAVRAIGQANKANPISIIVPCHRVIGKNGHLMGYAGSRTDIKAKLLQIENAGSENKM